MSEQEITRNIKRFVFFSCLRFSKVALWTELSCGEVVQKKIKKLEKNTIIGKGVSPAIKLFFLPKTLL